MYNLKAKKCMLGVLDYFLMELGAGLWTWHFAL